MKRHFIDELGLTFYSMFYAFVICAILLLVVENKYKRFLCKNYEEVTGFKVRYIDWDACYIKGGDGIFIRYDKKYKSVK